jgi:hypothetical protein
MPASLRSDFIHIASERTIHIAGIHTIRSHEVPALSKLAYMDSEKQKVANVKD